MDQNLKTEEVKPEIDVASGGRGDETDIEALRKETEKLKLGADLFELYKAEGNAYVKGDKLPEALEKYELAWKECTSDDEKAMILNNKGVVAEKMGDTDKAVELFTEALTIKPNYVKVLIRRALTYKAQKKYDEALADIAEAYVLAIKGQQVVTGMQEVIAGVVVDYAESEMNSLPTDRKFMFPKDHHVRAHFRQFYSDPVSRMWKGLDPSPLEDFKAAQGDATAPLYGDGFVAALECMKNENYQQVEGFCCKEIENSEGKYRLEALLLRGSIFSICGKKDEAEADFKAVIENPNASNKLKSTAYVKLALVMNLWSTAEDTAAQFAEAETIWKQNADVYYHAALCLIERGEAIPALALLEKGMLLCPDPKQSPVLHILALTIEMTCCGTKANPTETLGKLKEMESSGVFDVPECYEYYAQALLLFDNVDAALAQFDKAADLSKGERIFELKKVMAKQVINHDPEVTIKCLLEYADDPEVGNIAWHHIGEMNFILGRKEAGFEAFDKSINCCYSVADLRSKIHGKIDFKYHCILSEKMKKHGMDLLCDKEGPESNALE